MFPVTRGTQRIGQTSKLRLLPDTCETHLALKWPGVFTLEHVPHYKAIDFATIRCYILINELTLLHSHLDL